MSGGLLVTDSDGPGVAGPDTRRRPALDGMRAVAVLAVMLFHLGQADGGFLGVDVFFVLSGFLITSLLIGEREGTGRVALGTFYARRALRLLPAMAAVLVASTVAVLVVPSIGFFRHVTLHAAPLVVLDVGNWRAALQGSGSLGLLAHTWSLAVEEQFYLVWPAVFVVVTSRTPRWRLLAGALAAVAGAEMVLRAVLIGHGLSLQHAYYGSDLHSDGLLVGCALAFAVAGRPPQRKITPRRGRALDLAALVGVAVTSVSVAVARLDTAWSMRLWVPLVVLSTAAVLADLVLHPVRPLARLLASRPAVWVGRRTYGVYLWHILVFNVISPGLVPAADLHGGELVATDVARMVVSLVVAGLSYRFVELPFLRRKARLRPPGPRPAGLVDAPVLSAP